MADGENCYFQQANLVRTFLWRRVTEQALHGSSFVNIPDEINQPYIGDLIRISEAFAAPLSNLFAFVKSGHPACPFITAQTARRLCKPPILERKKNHKRQMKKDVDALTFMRTVLMSFVGGMEYGEQTLPTMTVAMEQQGFTPCGSEREFWISAKRGRC